MKKRILSTVLALVMCLSLLPAQVLAATEPAAEPATPAYPAIHAGVDGITGWDAETNTYDYIYYGNWQNSGQTAKHPLKWRVLDDETNMGTEGLFLLSERILASSRAGMYFEQTGDVTGEKFETGLAGLKNLFDSLKDPSGADGALNVYKTYGYNTMYRGSDIYNWLTDFAGVTDGAYAGRNGQLYDEVEPAFSAAELAAILSTTKSDRGYIATSIFQWAVNEHKTNACFPYANILENDKVFLMSAEEAEAEKYGFGGSTYDEEVWADRIGDDYLTDGATDLLWTRTWLRSYVGYYEDDYGKERLGVMCQYHGGSVEVLPNFEIDFSKNDALSGQSEAMTSSVRPAFNLNSSKIAFTPAADNSTHQSFDLVDTVSDKVWKVTLLDGNDFSADASVSGNLVAPGGTLTVNHKALSSFAGAGYTNVTVALIDEAGNVAAYGSINTASDATTSTITIPAGLEEGVYTLSVQAEDWNDAQCTDFASKAFTAEITVADTHTHINTTNYITTEEKLAAMDANDYGFLIEDVVLNENTVYTGTLCLNGHKLIGDLSVSDLTLYDCKGTGSVDSITVTDMLTLHTALSITTGKLDLGANGVVEFGQTLSVAKPYTLQISGDRVFTSGWNAHMSSTAVTDVFVTPMGHDIAAVNGELKITARQHVGGNHDSCGVTCTHDTDHKVTGEWIAINSYEDIIENSTQIGNYPEDRKLNPGNYYLRADLNAENVNISLLQISGTVNFCLNGYTYNNALIEIPNGATLNLCDCAGTGAIKLRYRYVENLGAAILPMNVQKGGTLNFYSGKISGTTESGATNINAAGTFNMYGGQVTYVFYQNGAWLTTYAVHVPEGGTFNMSGGEIAGEIMPCGGRTVNISGKVKLGKSEQGAFKLQTGENNLFTVSNLEEGSNIILEYDRYSLPTYDNPIILPGMAAYKDHFSLLEKDNSEYFYFDTDENNLLIRRVKGPGTVTVTTADGETVTMTTDVYGDGSSVFPIFIGQSKSFVMNLSTEDVGYAPYVKANGKTYITQFGLQFTITAGATGDGEAEKLERLDTIRIADPVSNGTFGRFKVNNKAFNLTYSTGTGEISGTIPDSVLVSDIETTFTLPGETFTSASSTQYGWAAVDNGEKVFDLEQTITARDLADYHAADGTVTLYPAWRLTTVSATFHLQDSESEDFQQTFAGGGKASEPTDPTRTGYTFDGWYTDAACTKPYDFNNEVNDHLDLYAKWDVNYYAVDFNANGHGTAPDWQRVAYGSQVTEPTAPTAPNYVFDGWYTDAACSDGNAYDFNTAVTDHLHLYAKWTESAPVTYTVTVTNGTGSGQYAEGDSVTITANDPETGKQFKGWTGADGLSFTDGSATTASATFTMPAKAVTVEANYENVSETPAALSGTVSIDGDAKFGSVLTANISGITNNTGTLSYQWKRGETGIGTNSRTYTLIEADIGETITVTVTSSVESGEIASAATATVEKANGPAAPAGLTGVAPTTGGDADGKIINTTAVMEYSTDSSFAGHAGTVCSETETTGLSAGTYYVRYKETATHKAGAYATVVVPAYSAAPVYSISLDTTGSYTFDARTVGYAAPTAKTVTVNNTGTGATGALTVALSGNDASSFELNKTSIADIAVSGSDTFAVVPKTGLSAGTYTVTVTVSGGNGITASFDISFTVNAATPTYGIALSPSGTQTFTVATVGYGAQSAKTITVNNTGTGATGALTVALSGNDASSFELNKTSIADIAVSGSDIFTVVPKSGLSAGTYTATVTVSGNNGIASSFDVSFTVNSAGGGGNGGGGGGYTPPSTPPVQSVTVPISGDEETIHVDASVKGDTATIDEVDLEHLDTVIGDDVQTGTVTIDFSGLGSSKPITTVEIPAGVVKEVADAVADPTNDAESLEIILSDGTSIEFDAEALGGKASQSDGLDITISIEPHEDVKITNAQKNAIGDRPAYDINVTSGGKHISDMGGKITVHAPYDLKAGENTRGIVVWYVDEHGNRERCETSYDPVKKRVNWKTDHLSLYMIDHCPSATFTDLDISAWYHEATDYVIENGMMAGYGETFGPNDSITRGQIVTILHRLEDAPVVNYLMTYEDVAQDKYYAEAIRWATSEGIVGGYGNGKFGPDDPITRQQLATMIYRYEQYKGGGFTGLWAFRLEFNDVADLSDYAYEPMCWCVMNGIVGGKGNGILDPNGPATRAQAAAMLMRYCELPDKA